MSHQHPTIIRAVKLSTYAAIGSSLAHNYRTMPVPHADEKRTHLNEDWKPASTPSAIKAAIRERVSLADRVAKRAVFALEYLVSAPFDAFAENGGPVSWKAYFTDALEWLERRHGAENVIAANIQLDEKTPHLVVYVCPLVQYPEKKREREVVGKTDPATGKQRREKRKFFEPAHTSLSANYFMGSREKLIRLQSDFAEQVGKQHGLRRGVERSALNHVDLKAYHDALMKGVQQHLDIPADLLKPKTGMLGMRRETPDALAERVTEALQGQVDGLMAQLATADIDRQRAKEWELTAARARKELTAEKAAHQKVKESLEGLTGGLTDKQVQKVMEYRQAVLRKRREVKQQREAEEKARLEQQNREKEQAMVDRLKQLSPVELAQLSSDERIPLWRLLSERNDLAELQDKFLESGYFHFNGRVISTPEKVPPQDPGLQKSGPEMPHWLKPSGRSGPSM
ncbi:plasmid recombination enzyme [Halomonas alkaliantarctica]|nr:plasmid recombination enzyme [Halomonas alkaliantarctica]